MNVLPGEAVGTAIFSRGFLLKPERVKETVAKLPGILNGNFDILVDGQILDEENDKLLDILLQISISEIKEFSIIRLMYALCDFEGLCTLKKLRC